jgi:hypothetical protein
MKKRKEFKEREGVRMAYYSLLMIAIQMEMGDMQGLSVLSWGFSLTKKGRSREREREFCPLGFVCLTINVKARSAHHYCFI